MVEDLRNNVNRLIALYEAQKQRADELASKLVLAESRLAQSKEEIERLTRQTDNLKLAGAFSSDTGNALAKDRINKLIREIDKCIALLEE